MPPDHRSAATGDAGVVLLAAGESARMGGDKMLLDLAGNDLQVMALLVVDLLGSQVSARL